MRTFRHFLIPACLCAVFIPGCANTSPEDVSNTAAKVTSTPAAGNAAAPDGKVAAQTQSFANSKTGLEGDLLKNYVDFSFQYPSDWELKREAGDPKASNFVKVEKALRDKKKGDFTLENFAVGYFQGTGQAATDAKLYPELVRQLSASFSKFPNYKKLSENPVTIGSYKGYEFRFESRIPETAHGPVTLWGRTILLPNPKAGNKQGVTLVLLATSLQKELKSAADVGVKGELPAILKSFKFE